MRFPLIVGVVILFGSFPAVQPAAHAQSAANDVVTWPGTEPLTWDGDIASRMIEGIDRFLLSELEKSVDRREQFWQRDVSSAEDEKAYAASLEPTRQRLAHILGLRDARIAPQALEFVASTSQPPLVGESERFKAYAVRWPAFANVTGEGLLLVPAGQSKADVVAIPDADVTPEQLAGLAAGLPAESQYARRLAESGCRVLIPMLIDRRLEARNGRARLTSREFVYRSAFELGRHLIGYELHKILAGVDWFEADGQKRGAARPIGVIGWGEGGMLALYAAALDTRIDAVCVSGHFDSRQTIWNQPLDRNVFGLLERFGDAELAAMIAPRAVVVEACRGPEVTLPSEGGGPADLKSPELDSVRAEVERAQALLARTKSSAQVRLLVSGDQGQGPCGSETALIALVQKLGLEAVQPGGPEVKNLRPNFDPAERHARQLQQMDRHNQELLVESPYVRQQFMNKLDTTSLETYQKSVEWYREFFRQEVIGQFPYALLPAQPRSRKRYETEQWTGYEVVLDVFPDVFAYGILIVPKGIPDGEKRPVVVCQHGLEGRPQDIVQGDHPAYHDFASKLAERGFITFSPQNIYIFRDRFRTLQRKANPIKTTLFSVMVPQHQQIVNWLSSLPQVDPQRIAFYGLSYGGKSAMRIPPLVPNYCLSICSADFNEWVWKNASSRAPHSYVWTGEYEIFEFDLGSTFNYAEMAALICPRPFMVERGHFDGVAPDETVGYEFAKVRFLYQGRLKLKDRCEIEWFDGPHTINGQGTFAFLHKHLSFPAPQK
jgi:dienelactone hydrolase